MDKIETMRLIAKIKAFYPYYLNNADTNTLQMVADVSQKRLQKYPAALMDELLTDYVMSGNKYAPSALQLVGELEKTVEKAAKGWRAGEGWPETPALRKYICDELQKDLIFRQAMDFIDTGKIADPVGLKYFGESRV